MNKLKCRIKCEYIEIFLLSLSIFFATIIFLYVDLKTLSVFTVQIWDALFSGRIHEFFLVSAENLRNSPGGGDPYGILYLIPWSIWNFPVWVTHIGKNLNILTPACLWWSKLFLVLCSVVTSLYVKKIIEKFIENKKIGTLAFILTLGSGSLMVSVGYSGQDEIIYLLFMLMGIYYLIVGKKKIAFVLLGYAVICCNAIIIPIFALLLLYEKNILKLLFYLILFLTPDKIVSFLCGSNDIEWLVNSSQYNMAANYTLGTYVDWFFTRTVLNTGVGTISIYVIILIFVYLKCYLAKTNDKEELNYDTLFYPTVLLISMCLCSWLHFYRFCICIPLLVCTVLINGWEKHDYTVGVFLLTIFNYIQTYVSLEDINNFSFKYNLMNDIGISDSHLNSESVYSIAEMLIPKLGLVTICINSCYWATAIFLIIYIYKKRQACFNFNISERMIRLAYVILPMFLIIVYLVIWENLYVTKYDIHSESALAEAINGQNEIYQKYEAKGTCLKYIEVRSCTWDRIYPDDLYLYIDLVDSETKEIVETKSVCANSLPNNDNIRVYFNTGTNQQKIYYFRFYSNNNLDNEENDLYLMQVTANDVNENIFTSSIVEIK